MIKGIESKSLTFVLNGKVLKGRFAIKRNRNSTVIQKFKDKYAKEEDVLAGDLIRTISTMVPGYDEAKVQLTYPKRTKEKKIPKVEVQIVEKVSADKTIGVIDFHFAFYTSDDEPEICVVTSAANNVLVLRKERSKWMALLPATKAMLKNEREFTEHADAWYKESSS